MSASLSLKLDECVETVPPVKSRVLPDALDNKAGGGGGGGIKVGLAVIWDEPRVVGDGSGESCPCEACLGEACPNELCLNEPGPSEACPNELCLGETCLGEACPNEPGLGETCPDETGCPKESSPSTKVRSVASFISLTVGFIELPYLSFFKFISNCSSFTIPQDKPEILIFVLSLVESGLGSIIWDWASLDCRANFL